MTKIVSILFSCVIALAALTSCGSDRGDEEEQRWDRRPMVYAYDEIYYESDYVKELPEGTELIGSIEKQIDPSELPDENFESNWSIAPLGASIYAGEDKSVIYIESEDSEDGGYMVYTTDIEEASRKKKKDVRE